MLSVTCKSFMLSVVMLNVVMLSVVALQTGKTVNLMILGAREDLGKGMGPWLGKVNLICQVAKFKTCQTGVVVLNLFSLKLGRSKLECLSMESFSCDSNR